ncbi:LA_0442/LA_0875 N-terminal domain-containing protein [Leptospira koniambonensis]|uniref:LA_0442/LA_0875 N-terminal domain-containing protein n=1 Tax=Leptospira koniambonensis TaxID=2484950 RepID=UPI003CC610B8
MFYLKRIFVLSLLALIPINIFSETQYVYMKDGRILQGEVLHQNSDKIKFKNAEGKEVEILKNSVERIVFKKPDIEAKREQETKLKAEREAKLKRKREAKLKAEQETKSKAEQKAKLKAEQEAKLKAEQEAKLKTEQEEKLKTEQETKLKAEQEAKLKAEEEAKQKEIEEENKQIVVEEKPKTETKPQPTAETHKLEILAGIGRSKYESQVPNFHRGVEGYATILGGRGGFFNYPPARKDSDAKTINLRYTWNRFVGEIGGSHMNSLESTTSVGYIVYPDLSSNVVSQGAFTAQAPFNTISYKQINAQISYTAYKDSLFEIRPILGYHKIWQTGKDNSTYDVSPKDPNNSSSVDWAIRYGTSFSDYLSGPSVGLAIESKWKEKWETRFELQRQFLHGNSIYTRDQIALILGGAYENRAALNNEWKVDGLNISGKLIYHWKDSVFFWGGFQYSKLSYKMQNLGGDLDLSGDPVSAYVTSILIQSLTQGLAGNSIAKAIFVGAGYSLDFSKKETQ